MKVRLPAVAGRFYPGTAAEIRSTLGQILLHEKDKINYSLSGEKIIGGISPHAGYMFSAYQAVHLFEILKRSEQQFDTFIIINPNHTGYGAEISIDENEAWETPLGIVPVDSDFQAELGFTVSSLAHRYEHSGEVMVPMLQYFLDYEFKILPVTMSHQNVENAVLIANAIFEINKFLKKNICIIASSDFSHYIHPDEGRRLDGFVINEILKLNSVGVYREIKEKNISACGFGPIMTLIEYSKLTAENPKAEILKIGHSGEVIPSEEVVDYVSMLFYDEKP
jgi:AmmeMemoRadiSam system protein B